MTSPSVRSDRACFDWTEHGWKNRRDEDHWLVHTHGTFRTPHPAAPGSTVPRVESILSDIGDEQSLDKHLSTFSGHIANICNILKRVETGALVLLDELVWAPIQVKEPP